jgi:Inner membrane protein YgaP-like, transmembrane domain
MSLDHKIRLIAGTFILASLALGWWVSPYWFLFTAFVGVNLVQSSITKWCLMEDILRRTGIHRKDEAAA